MSSKREKAEASAARGEEPVFRPIKQHKNKFKYLYKPTKKAGTSGALLDWQGQEYYNIRGLYGKALRLTKDRIHGETARRGRRSAGSVRKKPVRRADKKRRKGETK